MIEAAKYTAVEHLRDGRQIEIRALRPADEDDMLAAIDRTGARSLYRRFFVAKRNFSESEKVFFLNVDFVSHVALAAVAQDVGRNFIVGGGRYVVARPETAEVAFAVIDDHQGRGIGGALLRHLVRLANDAGIKELIAEVLPENQPMLKVFRNCGLDLQTQQRAGVVHVRLILETTLLKTEEKA